MLAIMVNSLEVTGDLRTTSLCAQRTSRDVLEGPDPPRGAPRLSDSTKLPSVSKQDEANLQRDIAHHIGTCIFRCWSKTRKAEPDNLSRSLSGVMLSYEWLAIARSFSNTPTPTPLRAHLPRTWHPAALFLLQRLKNRFPAAGRLATVSLSQRS